MPVFVERESTRRKKPAIIACPNDQMQASKRWNFASRL